MAGTYSAGGAVVRVLAPAFGGVLFMPSLCIE